MSKTLSALANPSTVAMTCVGLFIFLTVFVGALIWIHRKGSAQFYEEMSLMPLNSDSTQRGQ